MNLIVFFQNNCNNLNKEKSHKLISLQYMCLFILLCFIFLKSHCQNMRKNMSERVKFFFLTKQIA